MSDRAGVLREALRRVRAKTLAKGQSESKDPEQVDEAKSGGSGSQSNFAPRASRLNKPEGQTYVGPRKSQADEPGDTEDAMDELSKSSEEKRERKLR